VTMLFTLSPKISSAKAAYGYLKCIKNIKDLELLMKNTHSIILIIYIP